MMGPGWERKINKSCKHMWTTHIVAAMNNYSA
jgi:hypothetical protein